MLVTGLIAATAASKWLIAAKIIKLTYTGTRIVHAAKKYVENRKDG